MVRPRLAVAAGAFAGVLGFAAPARAQYVDWRAAFTMSGQYNRQVTDAPYPTAQTLSGPSIGLSPAINLLYDTPRTDNTFTYTFSINVPFTTSFTVKPIPLTYTNRLTYSGRYALSEVTTMSLMGNFSEAPLNSFTSVNDPTEAPIMTTPTGALVMLTATLQEGLTRQLKDSWSLTQSTSAGFGYPIDTALVRARTFTLQSSLTLSKNFAADTLGMTLTNSTNYFTASEGAFGAVAPAHTQLTNAFLGNWTRTFTPSFSSALSIGVTQLINPDGVNKTSAQPSGSLTLNYSRDLATVALSYQHMAMPNLTTGQINFVDTVAARFSLPFGPEKLGLSSSGSAGFTHSTPIGGDGTPGAPSNVFVADAAANYKPPFAPTLATSLRFQVQRQVPSADPTAAFTAYAISFSLMYAYPTVQAATVLPRMTPVFSVTNATPSDVSSSDRPYSEGFNVPAAEDTPAPQQQ